MPSLRPLDRYQHQLFSSLEDQISDESIVRVIDILIDKLYETVDESFKRKTEVGRPNYPKKSLLKLFIYGYMNRIKSSRMLERECKINLEVLWLMGRLQPDHWTISNFRKENLDEIRSIIKKFVRFLRDSEYIDGKVIVVDGTKIRANASSEETFNSYQLRDRVEDIDKKIAYYLEVSASSDEEEDYKERIEKLKQEKEELESQIAELKKKGKKIYIKGDPESSIMRTKDGKKPGYNVQITSDSKNKLIVASEVTDQVNDFKQLRSMYEKSSEMLESKPEEYIADAGYYTTDDIELIEKQGTDVYVSEPPERAKGTFTYDKQNDEYTCKNNKKLRFGQFKNKSGRRVRIYKTTECIGCPFREECTSSKNKHKREKIRYSNQEYRDEYRQRMRKAEALEKLKRRKAIVEHPFGIIKEWLGKKPLLLRGKGKVISEISLITLSYNIFRIFNIAGCGLLIDEISNYQWREA
jgi:transposase